LLSLYSNFLALHWQAQHAARGYDKVIIQVLRESPIGMPMEEMEVYVPSQPPMELA
jgi:hypothetical protein